MRDFSIENIDPSELSPDGQLFWAFVRARMVTGPLGAAVPRRQFDPVEMPPVILPWLALFDEPEPGSFFCRLFGTGLVRRHGREMTGAALTDIVTSEPVDDILARFTAVIRDRKWQVSRIFTRINRRDVTYERVLIPLSRPDDSVGWVAGFIGFLQLPERQSVLDLLQAEARDRRPVDPTQLSRRQATSAGFIA